MEIDMDEMDDLVEQGYTLDQVLAHYGVKGMHWGVNRAAKKARTSKKPQPGDSEEHVRSRQLHSTAKTQGIRKLTNKDLEDLNKRLNLEQNYANLTTKTKRQNSSVATGATWLGKKVGKIGDMALDEVTKAHLRVQLHEKGLLPTVNNGK